MGDDRGGKNDFRACNVNPSFLQPIHSVVRTNGFLFLFVYVCARARLFLKICRQLLKAYQPHHAIKWIFFPCATLCFNYDFNAFQTDHEFVEQQQSRRNIYVQR